MGLLQNLVKGMGQDKKVLKSKVKEEEQNRKVQRILDEREKSSNQRELEKYMKQKQEEKIASTLSKIRKQQTTEMWKGNYSVLKSPYNVLETERPLLKEKNIFNNKSSTILNSNKNLNK